MSVTTTHHICIAELVTIFKLLVEYVLLSESGCDNWIRVSPLIWSVQNSRSVWKKSTKCHWRIYVGTYFSTLNSSRLTTMLNPIAKSEMLETSEIHKTFLYFMSSDILLYDFFVFNCFSSADVIFLSLSNLESLSNTQLVIRQTPSFYFIDFYPKLLPQCTPI